MHIVIAIIIFLALIIGPGIWVKRVMERYSKPADRYPQTGGESARRLLDSLGLHKIGVETTDSGDHYDPKEKMVRLTASNFDNRSLTAVTIAAHEVGHALQIDRRCRLAVKRETREGADEGADRTCDGRPGPFLRDFT